MTPNQTLANQSPDIQKAVRDVEGLRRFGKMARLINMARGMVVGKSVVQVGEGVIDIDEPEFSETPVPEVEVPAPAKEIVENPEDWLYSGPDKVAAAKASPRWGRIDEAQVEFQAKDIAATEAAGTVGVAPENATNNKTTELVGLPSRRVAGSTDIDAEFRHDVKRTEVAAVPSAETPTNEFKHFEELPPELAALQVTRSGLPRRRPGNVGPTEVDPLGIGEVAVDENSPTPLYGAGPVKPETSDEPAKHVFDPLDSSIPVEVVEKKYDIMEMRRQARESAVSSAAGYADGRGLETAMMADAFNNQDPYHTT